MIHITNSIAKPTKKLVLLNCLLTFFSLRFRFFSVYVEGEDLNNITANRLFFRSYVINYSVIYRPTYVILFNFRRFLWNSLIDNISSCLIKSFFRFITSNQLDVWRNNMLIDWKAWKKRHNINFQYKWISNNTENVIEHNSILNNKYKLKRKWKNASFKLNGRHFNCFRLQYK